MPSNVQEKLEEIYEAIESGLSPTQTVPVLSVLQIKILEKILEEVNGLNDNLVQISNKLDIWDGSQK